MDENATKFVEELKRYKAAEASNFANGKSKEQMKREIEAIFDKHGIDKYKAGIFAKFSENDGVSVSRNSYPKEIAKKLYNLKQKKNEAQKDSANNGEDKEKQYSESDEEKQNKQRKFDFSLNEIKNLNDNQLKDYFRNKMLTHGWTEEEINKPCGKDAKSSFTDNSIPENSFSVNTNGLTVLESIVNLAKLIIKIKVLGQEKEQVLKDYNDNLKNIVKKWNDNKQENFGQDFDNNYENDLQPQIDDLVLDEPDLDMQSEQESLVDDDALTEEDIELINMYGIDAKNHTELVDFFNSEEGRQIQQMQTNALSKSDSIPN